MPTTKPAWVLWLLEMEPPDLDRQISDYAVRQLERWFRKSAA